MTNDYPFFSFSSTGPSLFPWLSPVRSPGLGLGSTQVRGIGRGPYNCKPVGCPPHLRALGIFWGPKVLGSMKWRGLRLICWLVSTTSADSDPKIPKWTPSPSLNGWPPWFYVIRFLCVLHWAGPKVTKQQALSHIPGAKAGRFHRTTWPFLFAVCLGARPDIVFKSCL